MKASDLAGRYITNADILPLLNNLSEEFSTEIIGHSEQNRPIYSVAVGKGATKILIWSQMHGNESTCTKALFDVFNFLKLASSSYILQHCSLVIIPILNPDGAEVYTRHNANNVDLNRDATQLTQKESKVLRKVFDAFKPDYGFNMHDQRTLFNVGQSDKPATVSFLATAQDVQLSLTPNRLRAMSVIHQMNLCLQQLIPGQIGRFDDAFNINCVGDYFQAQGVATILFEAGHFPDDYNREETRKFIALSILEALSVISSGTVSENDLNYYLEIPENDTLFFDILLKNVLISSEAQEHTIDIGITYQETLTNHKISFLPQIKIKGDLSSHFGHISLNLNQTALDSSKQALKVLGRDFCDIITKNC
ncbi:MAG: M14 family metallopeptidase [Flavobacteriaceae bacterium]|nr:M14 family metallopeptidase [Flavobacteriaceae bacterium]